MRYAAEYTMTGCGSCGSTEGRESGQDKQGSFPNLVRKTLTGKRMKMDKFEKKVNMVNMSRERGNKFLAKQVIQKMLRGGSRSGTILRDT